LWADMRPRRITTVRRPLFGAMCVVWPANRTVAQLAVLDPNEPGASLARWRGPATARNRSWIFLG
jgi:hypothetical protein